MDEKKQVVLVTNDDLSQIVNAEELKQAGVEAAQRYPYYDPDAENPLDKLGLPKSPLLGETDPRFLKPYRLPGESKEEYRARREAANNYVKYTQRYGSGK